MRKFVTWLLLSLVASVSLMVAIHWQEARHSRGRAEEIRELAQRQKIADGAIVSLEQYRRSSARFRNMTEPEIATAKQRLRREMEKSLGELQALRPTEAEKAAAAKVTERLAEFQVLAAKLEPQLFTRDIFQKEEARNLHETLASLFADLSERASLRSGSVLGEIEASASRSMRLLVAVALGLIAGVSLLLARQYWVHARPLARLDREAAAIRAGKREASRGGKLSGVYGDISRLLTELSSGMEAQRSEREQLLSAIAADFRAPLLSLQAGARLIGAAERLEPAERSHALDLVRKSAVRFSRALDDLSDLGEHDRKGLQLDESLVELGELLDWTSAVHAGLMTGHRLELLKPATSVLAYVDRGRLERVLLALSSKLALVAPRGAGLSLRLSPARSDGLGGFELALQTPPEDSITDGSLRSNLTDSSEHWLSANGFGVALARRIVLAHGGKLLASGEPGEGLQFILRFPESRLANSSPRQVSQRSQAGAAEAAPSGFAARARVAAGVLERTGIQAMLPQQIVNFSS